MKDIIFKGKNNYNDLKDYLDKNNLNNLFIVTFDYTEEPKLISFLRKANKEITLFAKFTPNPKYEEVVEGVKLFNKSKANCIIAIGGGSAMDVAKCIKAYSTMDPKENYLKQEIVDNKIPLIAVPTTAGTGSERTRYAVIYFEGKKQSVTSNYIIPNVVLFDSNFLKTLPMFQKKATVLDTFSHSIESYWSVNKTEESIKYSTKALRILLKNMNKYFKEDESVYDKMLEASFYAGKAINITQTTAGHAMSYKITSLYRTPHGLAAALVNSELLPYMIENTKDKDLLKTFDGLKDILKLKDLDALKGYIRKLLKKLDLYNVEVNRDDIDTLVDNVNPDRLKNNPFKLDKDDIRKIYNNIFDEIERRK